MVVSPLDPLNPMPQASRIHMVALGVAMRMFYVFFCFVLFFNQQVYY